MAGWMGAMADMEDEMHAHQLRVGVITTHQRADAVDLEDPTERTSSPTSSTMSSTR